MNKTFKGLVQLLAWNNQNGKENSVQFIIADGVSVLVSNTIVSNVVFRTTGTHVPIPVIIAGGKVHVEIEYAEHKKDEVWTNEKSGATGKYNSDGFHVVKLTSLTLSDKVTDIIIDNELRRSYVNPNVITLDDDPMKS